MEHRGRKGNSVSDHAYPFLEGEESSYFGGVEGQEVKTVGKDDAPPIPKGTMDDYEGRTCLSVLRPPDYDVQDFGVRYDDPWG